MSKRAKPPPAKPRERWDRKRLTITLLALLIVLTMLLSGLSVLFYR